MTDIILFGAPGSCSRVTSIVLEEIGVPFEFRLVRFMAGFHKSLEYKAVNPKAKIPALVVDGEALTENVAIIGYLDRTFPEAGVLPRSSTAMDAARLVADLCFCGSTLHPLVTRIRMPGKIGGEQGAASVREVGSNAMDDNAVLIEARLSQGPWWYGDRWSAMDAYLYWVFFRLDGSGYDLSSYPHYSDHFHRMQTRPSVQRAVARDDEAEAVLSAERMQMAPGGAPKAA